jgi:hypothetical protein
MDKRSRNILYLFGIFMIVIMVVEITRPQPINWKASYSSQDKIPFGMYILHQEIEELLEVSDFENVNESCYTYLLNTYLSDENHQKKAYFFVNNYLYFDDEETFALLDFVEAGHMAFLSAKHFSGKLRDTLKIETHTSYHYEEIAIKTKLYSASFSDDTTTFKRGVNQSYFTHIDTLNTTALGYYLPTEKNFTTTYTESGEFTPEVALNYIKIPHGNGYFFIHTLPEAFTNYYLLNGNHAYASRVLSHFDVEHLLWDDYKKSGRKFIESPMRFVLSETTLKWAYYITIVSLILFVLYKGKREQRIIPVREPLKNTTGEFTKTIGDLYFQHRDYSNLIAKKNSYFLERVRSQFYLNTTVLDETFAEKLAQKKGKSKEDVIKLVQLLRRMKEKTLHTEEDLISLNQEIEKFEH